MKNFLRLLILVGIASACRANILDTLPLYHTYTFADSNQTGFVNGWITPSTLTGGFYNVTQSGKTALQYGGANFNWYMGPLNHTSTVGLRGYYWMGSYSTQAYIFFYVKSTRNDILLQVSYNEATSTLTFANNAGTTLGTMSSFTPNQWNQLDIYFVADASNGFLQTWLAGSQVLNLSNLNTKGSANSILVDSIEVNNSVILSGTAYNYIAALSIYQDSLYTPNGPGPPGQTQNFFTDMSGGSTGWSTASNCVNGPGNGSAPPYTYVLSTGGGSCGWWKNLPSSSNYVGIEYDFMEIGTVTDASVYVCSNTSCSAHAGGVVQYDPTNDRLQLRSSYNGTVYCSGPNDSIGFATWHHVYAYFFFNASAGVAQLYLDRQLACSATNVNTGSSAGTSVQFANSVLSGPHIHTNIGVYSGAPTINSSMPSIR